MSLIGESWLDTEDYGVVDRLDTESIVTSFYEIVFPIWPAHSAYVIVADDGSVRRIRIPLQLRSVVLGYVRAPAWFATLFLLAPALLMPQRHWLLVPALLLAILASLLQFVAGRLPEPE